MHITEDKSRWLLFAVQHLEKLVDFYKNVERYEFVGGNIVLWIFFPFS